MQQSFFLSQDLKWEITHFLLWKLKNRLNPLFKIAKICQSCSNEHNVALPKKLIIIFFILYIYFSTFLGISFPQKSHGQKDTFLLQLLYRRFQWGKVHEKKVQIRLRDKIKFWSIHQYLLFIDTSTLDVFM